ncbi:MAG: aspartate-semialdehyde dehydrogenase [Bacteroidales bacterium]|nr:aspartate-semialdehyde dehydrogenase [Bacteroidales bacterium]MCF8326878.1 aspartate-semialdehyde dehydrogenase [Bacteroidales bacterium]
MDIIVGGATGLVGQEILEVLEEMSPQVTHVIPAASERSVGKHITFRGQSVPVVSFARAADSGAQVAIFSAGSDVSRKWAKEFSKKGITVIDNSSAWRMDPEVPLVVPEVNAHHIQKEHKIIANPNCSTIQMVVALAPLHKDLGIKRVVVSTYQSVSGSGLAGIDQLEAERNGKAVQAPAYPHPIDKNALPHGGNFTDNNYTSEEIKLIDETRKILDEPQMAITSTVVRIPVTGGHSESVNIEFEKPFSQENIKKILSSATNIKIEDDPKNNFYPMPVHIRKSNFTHVGRIRRDFSVDNGINLWIVADNLRKGAATNAVQILNYILDKQA